MIFCPRHIGNVISTLLSVGCHSFEVARIISNYCHRQWEMFVFLIKNAHKENITFQSTLVALMQYLTFYIKF